MEKLITILFNSEDTAFKASEAIHQLAADKDINITEFYVLSKNKSGDITIKNADKKEIGYSPTNLFMGGFVETLGGPLYVLAGMTNGTFVGKLGSLLKNGKIKTSKILNKVSKIITAGKTAIVAQIYEYWEIPLNTALESFDIDIKRLNVNEEINKYIDDKRIELSTNIINLKNEIKEVAGEPNKKFKKKLESEIRKLEEMESDILEKSKVEESKKSERLVCLMSKILKWESNR
ncbi:Predicted membrane protein [Sphingobacterium multivorum]|uniref:hypothetical protein n=1 Tax=Sphingobacterium multivorum TaxID=28454 RepID=UPI000E081555|nr:hypothetical protein [Sphingobacterium multivorum]QQT46646.1 hypothetical protein I6J00_08315 [Sphingobacterium multivorum]SUJ89301.1 Predicted membrane protein [Sphingobacterium multivorum]